MSKPRMIQKRILFSFVGNRDPFNGDDAEAGDGPLLTLVSNWKFDSVYLLYNNDEFLRRASTVYETLMRRPKSPDVRYVEIPVKNPTDYVALYESMQNKCMDVAEEEGPNCDYFVSTSSGTPQMQTCWLMLVLGCVIKAQLLQVDPPNRVAEGCTPIREINLAVDKFPRIHAPSKLKRELAVATNKVNELKQERDALEREIAPNLVGSSKMFRSVVATAKQAAKHDVPILITGETGTGKEEIAKLIHFSSDRRESPFLPINCAGIPEAIFESELFGHEKGAFTDASEAKIGLLEAASDGTVFLDELGELPLTQQAKLLRVLEDGKFRPIGESSHRQCKARFVAATNRDLESLVERGQFREDLLYRLCVFPIEIPPLRNRKEDINELVKFFLEKYGRKFAKQLAISEAALESLSKLPWNGNVRELQHAIQRIVISTEGREIQPKHLLSTGRKRNTGTPLPHITLGDVPIDLPKILGDWERDLIAAAIERFQGNRSAAARHLGISEANFRRKAREILGHKHR